MSQMIDKRKLRSSHNFEVAMIQLLNKMDYEEITVSKLIKEADYSRTAFYNSYLDKDDCLTKILDRHAKQICDSIFLKAEDYAPKLSDCKDEDSRRIFWDTEAGNQYELTFRAPYEIVYANKALYQALYLKMDPKWHQYFFDKLISLAYTLIPLKSFGSEAEAINVNLWIFSHFWDTIGRLMWWIQNGLVYSPEYMGRQQYLRRIDGSYVLPSVGKK